jgi:hypothetical protein
MKTLELWNVQAWDGGDRHNHSFYIPREVISEDQLKAWDKHCLPLRQTLIILDNLNELPGLQQERLRQSALAKLTEQERKALGLE